MQIGTIVKILEPFHTTFTEEYAIIDIVDIVDGVYYLDGIEGGFDITYLKEV